jgi:hypothetical protein
MIAWLKALRAKSSLYIRKNKRTTVNVCVALFFSMVALAFMFPVIVAYAFLSLILVCVLLFVRWLLSFVYSLIADIVDYYFPDNKYDDLFDEEIHTESNVVYNRSTHSGNNYFEAKDI